MCARCCYGKDESLYTSYANFAQTTVVVQIAQVRAAEEALKIRRHASWIAKQVAGFWKKAERVVNYKVGLVWLVVLVHASGGGWVHACGRWRVEWWGLECGVTVLCGAWAELMSHQHCSYHPQSSLLVSSACASFDGLLVCCLCVLLLCPRRRMLL
jgi:hypothetical protein